MNKSVVTFGDNRDVFSSSAKLYKYILEILEMTKTAKHSCLLFVHASLLFVLLLSLFDFVIVLYSIPLCETSK